MLPQRDILYNCTNVTLEPTHDHYRVPLTPGRALVKRPHLSNDEGERHKRLKYTTQEPLPQEECKAGSGKEEEDGPVAFCVARRKRTFFHAKQALAMSRPGVTCRPLPCKSCFLSVTVRC